MGEIIGTFTYEKWGKPLSHTILYWYKFSHQYNFAIDFATKTRNQIPLKINAMLSSRNKVSTKNATMQVMVKLSYV